MIDEFKETGEYSFQIRLYDDNQVARVTLPPVQNGIVIKNPIAVENESIVELALVDSAVVFADLSEEVLDIFDDKNVYKMTDWQPGDVITAARLNKIEEGLYYVSKNGGGGATAPYISTTLPETVLVNTGDDLSLDIDFNSPNPGRGTLRVFVNNVDTINTKVMMGQTTTIVPHTAFTRGSNQITVYVIDRVGVISNTLTFYVRYGGLELETDFDPETAYDVGANIRFYFTPTALDTSKPLTMYMEIDGAVQEGVSCTSDTRGFFTFPNTLTAGRYSCRAWISDGEKTSTPLEFTYVLLDDTALVITSYEKTLTAEEGTQLSFAYKVYKKNTVLFNTEIYVNDGLYATGSCGVEKSYFVTDQLPEGTHTVKIVAKTPDGAFSDDVSWSVTITPSTYQMLQPIKTGAVFIASAKNKSNTDEDKNSWIGTNQDNEQIPCTMNNFAYNSENGWGNNELTISGQSNVVVPISPLSNNAKYGFTLDIEFSTKHIGVENAEVLTLWDDTKNCGIKITTDEVIMRSAVGNELRLFFSEDEIISAMFEIDRNEKTAKIFLNGVMCKCMPLNDYVASGVSYLEDFSTDSFVYLGGKDTNGWCKIKNLRIYEVCLSTAESLNNFICNITEKQAQRDKVKFQNGEHLPTLTVYGDFSGLGKNDKKPCDAIFTSTDVTKYGESWKLDGKYSMLQYQGTSSMQYPIKNYRLNPRDANGKRKLDPFNHGIGETRFTLKADFASSGHWQNTGLAKWINDHLYNYNVNDQKSMNPKKWFDLQNGGKLTDTRETIDGYICRLILVNDGETPLLEGQEEPEPGNTKDMGVFNFNNDKSNVKTMGFDSKNFPFCASFEVASNSDTSAGAFMAYDPTKHGVGEAAELAYYKESFELRYPDEDDVGPEFGFLGMNGDANKGIRRWINFADKSTDEEFVANFEQYFNKQYTFRYYILVMVLGMVDNLGKNMMLDTWDGEIAYPRFYDMDTICSFDNSGVIKFDTDIEMEQGYWNTSSSRLWTRVRDLFHDELIVLYNDMRKNGLSYESLMSYFYDEQIAMIPEKYYNMDYDVKYGPYADEYANKANGSSYEHLKRWLKRRIMFTDTLFDYAPAYTNDALTIRANTTELMTLEIETYVPVYQHLSWYNNQMDKKKINGKTAVTFTGKAQAATDQEVFIYGGSNIKRIRGLSSMNPDSMLIGNADRLMELECKNATILSDINSNKANLSANRYLSKVDLSGCTALGGTLRLNNSPLIQEINIQGTAIDNLLLSTSLRNLRVLKLPGAIKTLVFENLSVLEVLEIDGSPVIEQLSLTNCPNVDFTIFTTLKKINSLYLNNSLVEAEVLTLNDVPNMELINMPKLYSLNLSPNDEYEDITIAEMQTKPNITIKSSSCPNFQKIQVTAPQRVSYMPNDDGTIQPYKVFAANTFDISQTSIRELDLLCTSDIYNLKVPTTLECFICDSAYDLKQSVITDGAFKTIHNDLIKPYTEEFNENVLIKEADPNIIPTAANGSIICNMWSNNTNQPTSTSPYIWDLKGLVLEEFFTYGVNNKIDTNVKVVNDKRVKRINNIFYWYQGEGNFCKNQWSDANPKVSLTPFKLPLNVGEIKISTNVVSAMNNHIVSESVDGYSKRIEGNSPLTYTCTDGVAHYLALCAEIVDGLEWIQVEFLNKIYRFYFNDFETIDRETTYVELRTTYLTNLDELKTIVKGNDFSITMPKRISDYKVRMINANIKPDRYPTMFYPKFIDTVLPITGKVDYTTYTGESLAWAFAYTTDDVTRLPMPSNKMWTINNEYNKLYGTDYVDVIDVWAYKNDDFSNRTENPNIVKAYIELTSSNYQTRIDEVLQWYPNCTELYLFEDGSVTTLEYMYSGGGHNNANGTRDQVQNVTFMEGHFSNLKSLFDGFIFCHNLATVNNIPKSVRDFRSCFENCQKLNQQFDFSSFNIAQDGLDCVLKNCLSLTYTPILPTDYKGGLSGAFLNTKITTAPAIPDGVTSLRQAFQNCKQLTTVGNIPSSCNVFSSAFDYCSNLVSVPETGWKGNMNSAFNGCVKLNQKIVISSLDEGVQNGNYIFNGCISLSITPVLPDSYNGQLIQTFAGTALTTPAKIPNNVTNINGCYKECSKLTEVTIPITNLTTYEAALTGCTSLETINWEGQRTSDFNLITLGAPSYSKPSIINLANEHLDTVESATLTLSESCSDYLSVFEIFALSEKGWNVVGAASSGGGFKIVKKEEDTSTFTTDDTVTMALIELTQDNYKTRVYEVLKWYPNCNEICLYDDNSVTSLEGMFNNTDNKNVGTQITKVSTLPGYLTNVTNMRKMFSACKFPSLDLSSFDTRNITNMQQMFDYCYALTSLDLTNFNTSNVTDMSNMFSSCYGLTTLDLSNFNTSKVTTMQQMFEYCSALTSINLSSFDTSNVTDMYGMFYYCRGLTSIDLSSFNTSKVTDMSQMFENCNKLTSLDLSHFNTSKVTNIQSMFRDCTKLTSLNVINFDVSNVTALNAMFSGCSSITTLNLSSFITSNVTTMPVMFGECSNLTSLDISNFNTSKVTDMRQMFSSCKKLTSINLSSFDTSKVKDMSNMFYECSALTSLDLSNFNTSSVTTMRAMFAYCSSLTSLDLTNFNTSSVTDMQSMFSLCSNLTSLNLSNFNTSNITSMYYMFNSCGKLTTLDLSSFDTSKVTSMSNAFRDCSELTSVNISSFDTSKVTSMKGLFYGCRGLTTLDLSNFNTSKVTDMNCMFAYCSSITSLDLTNFNTSSVTDMGQMFYTTSSLLSLKFHFNFKAEYTNILLNINNNLVIDWLGEYVVNINLKLVSSLNFSLTNIRSLLLALGTVESATLNMYETQLNALSEEEKANAVSKGWTLQSA